MEITAVSPLDGWRSVVIECNNRRRDLTIKFEKREYCREFMKIIDRMDCPPALVQRDRNNVIIKFKSYEKSKYHNSRQQANLQEAHADASA